jgi:hypothetical protein
MEVRGLLHAPASQLLGRELLSLTGLQTGWASGSVWLTNIWNFYLKHFYLCCIFDLMQGQCYSFSVLSCLALSTLEFMIPSSSILSSLLSAYFKNWVCIKLIWKQYVIQSRKGKFKNLECSKLGYTFPSCEELHFTVTKNEFQLISVVDSQNWSRVYFSRDHRFLTHRVEITG